MILEREITGLPADKKKILIDYSSELSTEDRLKIAGCQDSMINDIIENSGHHHYYILSNNSDSINSMGIAPQLIHTMGSLERSLSMCMDFAINSLPVPVSPVISTEKSVFATFSPRARRALIFGSVPRYLSKPLVFNI